MLQMDEEANPLRYIELGELSLAERAALIHALEMAYTEAQQAGSQLSPNPARAFVITHWQVDCWRPADDRFPRGTAHKSGSRHSRTPVSRTARGSGEFPALAVRERATESRLARLNK